MKEFLQRSFPEIFIFNIEINSFEALPTPYVTSGLYLLYQLSLIILFINNVSSGRHWKIDFEFDLLFCLDPIYLLKEFLRMVLL